MTKDQTVTAPEPMSTFAQMVGKILGISYPVLAISTGARAIYQLFFKEDVTYYLPVLLSALAALMYLIATVGFARRTKRAWRISVGALAIETLLTLLVGTLSLIVPDVIGRTVWRHYGADYAFFPLVQPLIGLVWLLHPATLRAYGIRQDTEGGPASPRPVS